MVVGLAGLFGVTAVGLVEGEPTTGPESVQTLSPREGGSIAPGRGKKKAPVTTLSAQV